MDDFMAFRTTGPQLTWIIVLMNYCFRGGIREWRVVSTGRTCRIIFYLAFLSKKLSVNSVLGTVISAAPQT